MAKRDNTAAVNATAANVTVANSVAITIQLNGIDTLAGTLWFHARRGIESASFAYDTSYLASPSAIPISPDLPLVPGTMHSLARPMFLAFEDCMPDRWGRNLLARQESRRARAAEETPRTLLEKDFLLGVSDQTRQGALRFWIGDASAAPSKSGVPKEVAIPKLLEESTDFEQDKDSDIHDLFEAGSSLGGARPKASVVDEQGSLMIAKFPKADETSEEDVCAWEKVALDLAMRAGIRVPYARLLRVGSKRKSVLLVKRFDRVDPDSYDSDFHGSSGYPSGYPPPAHGDEMPAHDEDYSASTQKRIPYISGLTAVQGSDGGQYSYLELVEFLEENGSNVTADIQELWKRIVFSCLIGNTDDHMRNHGFLWDGIGWRLSPAFDINPTPGAGEKHLRCAIDLSETTADIRVALDACEYFRIKKADAKDEIAKIQKVMPAWRKTAMAQGISRKSIERMSSCFERAVRT